MLTLVQVVETRRNALGSIRRLATGGGLTNGELSGSLVWLHWLTDTPLGSTLQRAWELVFSSLRDCTVDQRGDVGSWLRCAAADAAADFVAHDLLPPSPQDLLRLLFTLSVEHMDVVRERAGTALLDSLPSLDAELAQSSWWRSLKYACGTRIGSHYAHVASQRPQCRLERSCRLPAGHAACPRLSHLPSRNSPRSLHLKSEHESLAASSWSADKRRPMAMALTPSSHMSRHCRSPARLP